MPRRPPHFKAFVSAKNHRKLPGIAADDAVLAMWLRAGWMCIERFADRTNNTMLVTQTDLAWIANTSPWVNVQRKLRRLVSATPLRLRCDCAASPLRGRCGCAAMSLTFPNLAKKHGFKGGNGAETVYHADADADVREEKSQRGVENGGEPADSQEPEQFKLNREPHYPNAAPSPENAPQPQDPAGSHTQSPVESSRGERGKRTEPSAESEAAFDLLLWAIDQSMPGASIPDAGSARWRGWCKELDRLHRLGERGGEAAGFAWEEIEAVIRWLPTHSGSGDFRWGLVVRSASKLRDHFARLLAECKRAQNPVAQSGGWRAAGKQVHRSMMETGDG